MAPVLTAHSHSHDHGHSHTHSHAEVGAPVVMAHSHSHDHPCIRTITHPHTHEHAHTHDHEHPHTHEHPILTSTPTRTANSSTRTALAAMFTRHDVPDEITWGSLTALAVSGGLVPCESALVLLLSAIALGRVGLGSCMLIAFSLGLALVLWPSGCW